MSKLKVIFVSLLFAAFGSACSISIDVTEENADAVVQVDFEGDCQGRGLDVSELGTVLYSKSDASGACVVDLEWNGPLVDMADIRADVEEDADISDVTLEAVEIVLKLVHIEDSQGTVVDVPTLTNFTGTVVVAGVPLYAIEASTIDALLSEEGLRIQRNGEDDPVVKAIDDALKAGGTLDASADAVLTISSLLPLQTNNPHRIVFRHDLKLTASAPILF